MSNSGFVPNLPNKPLWLLAELTYACPLQCPYCSNPLEFAKYKNELSTDDWKRVLREARKMGAAQLGFSGGEPLVRQDLEELIAEARQLGFYTNLITSGVGMDEKRIKAFREAGLLASLRSFADVSPFSLLYRWLCLAQLNPIQN